MRRLWWLVLLGWALLPLACSAGQSAPASAPGASPAEATAVPRQGGRLILDIASDVTDFDLTTSSRPELYYTAMAFSHLLRFKSGPNVQYTELIMEPELAERWEVAPDAKTFTFHLRRGVRFADLPPVNGREVTASDVKFSFEYVARAGELAHTQLPPSRNNWPLEGLEAIDTPDPYTVVVRFAKPFVPFLNYTTTGFLPILAREIYDQDGNFKDRSIGSGAFQLDREATQRGTRLAWKKHPGYWEQGKPYLAEVYQLLLPDVATARAAFQAKQIDMLTERIGPDTDVLRQANPSAVMFEFNPPGPQYLWLNIRPGRPFNDERLRKAFVYALDRDELIRTLTNGKGAWAASGAFPDTLTQEEIKQLVPYNPAEAKRLVVEAGYPNGIEVDFDYPGAAYGNGWISMIQLIQAQEKQAGININLKSMEFSELSLKRSQGNYVISSGGTKGLFADIDSYLNASFHPNSTDNNGKVDDPTLTALIAAEQRETDPAKRNEIVRQAVQLINEHVLGLVALYYQTTGQAWHPYVKGYYPHWANPGTTYTPAVTSIWLDK